MIRGYIAVSLDGFIADRRDSLDWLFKYNDSDFGGHDYQTFARSIATIVMGRSTYDFLVREGIPWTYEDKRVIVVTSRPITTPAHSIEVRSDLEQLIADLRAAADGDIWVMGGGKLLAAFIARRALEDVEIFIIPEIIGGGAALFPPAGRRATPVLREAEALPNGCLYTRYDFSAC